MYARIATFEGGDDARLQQLNEERMSDGTMNTPAGMNRVMLLSDGSSKRLFLAFFDSRDDLEAAEERFESMGDEIPEDIRGRRTSVEVYEVLTDQSI